MTQNTSSAVMAQRIEPPDSLDFFPTPPWATRAVCEGLKARFPTNAQSAWDPACGAGAMIGPLGEYFARVAASDVHDYGIGAAVQDFLWPSDTRADWIITNPPFRLGCDFALTALERARVGVAMVVRTGFLESVGRYNRLFRDHPPAVLQFTERVIMHRGILRDPSKMYWDEKAKKMNRPSTATAYCWLVWTIGSSATQPGIHWIPSCRRALERPGDYDG